MKRKIILVPSVEYLREQEDDLLWKLSDTRQQISEILETEEYSTKNKFEKLFNKSMRMRKRGFELQMEANWAAYQYSMCVAGMEMIVNCQREGHHQ